MYGNIYRDKHLLMMSCLLGYKAVKSVNSEGTTRRDVSDDRNLYNCRCEDPKYCTHTHSKI